MYRMPLDDCIESEEHIGDENAEGKCSHCGYYFECCPACGEPDSDHDRGCSIAYSALIDRAYENYKESRGA